MASEVSFKPDRYQQVIVVIIMFISLTILYILNFGSPFEGYNYVFVILFILSFLVYSFFKSRIKMIRIDPHNKRIIVYKRNHFLSEKIYKIKLDDLIIDRSTITNSRGVKHDCLTLGFKNGESPMRLEEGKDGWNKKKLADIVSEIRNMS